MKTVLVEYVGRGSGAVIPGVGPVLKGVRFEIAREVFEKLDPKAGLKLIETTKPKKRKGGES